MCRLDWVSEFSPPRTQKQLSYLVGWLCVLGWQVGNTAIGYLCGTIIQGLVILNNPSYEAKPWHGTLIIFAVLTFCYIFNAFLASKLPLLEGIVVVIHIAGFFAILIVLWVLADTTPASEVFTTFNNGGGWSTQGASCLVGILSPVFSFVGPDAATHMAEELRDASRSLPLAMVWTAIVNGAMGFVMIVTFCMMIGDVETALASPTGYAFIEVFYNATHSKAGTSVMVALFIIMLLFGCVTNFATSSRQLWAFVSSPCSLPETYLTFSQARDRGTPFSSTLAHVQPGRDIPLNSITATYVFCMLLSLINLGSAVALNIITSLGTGALLSSYIVSVSCIILKRLRGEPLLPRRWSLGKWGLPINIVSVLFMTLCFIMNFFPQSPHELTAQSFNWNIVIVSSTRLMTTI